ncbi:MAG: TetR/AcrR family transcriptional regulator [Pseudomonadota bacterium]
MTPRQKDRKDRILKAVLSYVEKHGYEGANIREIAKEAGVSPTTLYNIYGNKDHLILSAQEQVIASTMEGTIDSEDPVLSFLYRQESIAKIVRDNPNWATAMLTLTLNAEPGDRATTSGFNTGLSHAMIICQRMQDGGDLDKSYDIDRMAKSAMGAIWGVILFWLKGFIALHDLERDLKVRVLEALIPFATPKGLKRLSALRQQASGRQLLKATA